MTALKIYEQNCNSFAFMHCVHTSFLGCVVTSYIIQNAPLPARHFVNRRENVNLSSLFCLYFLKFALEIIFSTKCTLLHFIFCEYFVSSCLYKTA